MKKEKEVIMSENLIKINIVDDYWGILKKCRESYYYIVSLKSVLKGLTFVKTKTDLDAATKYISEIDKLIKEFQNLENTYLKEDSFQMHESEINKNTVSKIVNEFEGRFTEKLNYVDELDVFISLLKYIILDEKMNKEQLEALTFINNARRQFNSSLANQYDELKELIFDYNQDILLSVYLQRSSDEDKIITYEIYSNNRDIVTGLKKSDIVLPRHVKYKDYSFNISTLRDLTKREIKFTAKLLENISLIKNTREMETINKRMNKLTKIGVMLAILSTLASIISIFQAYK
ncbi:hypothetical protein [Clostridium algidicarnis]|uniref:hypothetical protein n=1 Tax=Clostridium algidicarnis TaxID=37659 RepID=UPI003FD75AAF